MENKKDVSELTNMKIKCNSKINNGIIYQIGEMSSASDIRFGW